VGQTFSQDQATDVIDGVRLAVVAGANISPSVERQVQEALDVLRAHKDTEGAARAERVSTTLFTLAQAKRLGRTNLYASQLLRLSRI
jgi:hypothetical protein